MNKLTAAIMILTFPALLHAQAISSHSGTFGDGHSVTITGNSFGKKGPHVEVFDDFELGSHGDLVKTGSGSAQVGQWDHSLDPNVTYSNTNVHGGKLAFRANHTNHCNNDVTAWFTGTREIFVSWWFLVPAGTKIPGEGGGIGSGWKQLWITGDATTDDDIVVPSLTSRGTAWIINGNDPSPGYVKYVTDEMHFHKGYWHHLAVWIKGGFNNDGNLHMWRITEFSGNMDLIVEDNNVNTLKSGGAWKRVGVALWGSTTANSYPAYDDVYIATGANARARVEIGNAESYYDCTEMAISTPTSWSDNKITLTFYTR